MPKLVLKLFQLTDLLSPSLPFSLALSLSGFVCVRVRSFVCVHAREYVCAIQVLLFSVLSFELLAVIVIVMFRPRCLSVDVVHN